MAYENMYRCPKCSSKDTSTTTIATSERWIEFNCGNCGRTFKKLAKNISKLSSDLGETARELSKMLNEFLF